MLDRILQLTKTHQKKLGMLGVFVALCIAILYVMVVPEEANSTSGIVRYILLYAHSACWLVLATASGLWAMDRSPRFIAAVAYSALGLYALFIGTLMAVKLL